MARPLIVIPARFSESASAIRYGAEVTARKLAEAVYAAGGEPVTIHPDVPTDLDEAVRQRVAFADGVLLPGGGDVAPHWSGQADHDTQYDVDETQDAFDLALARVALADGIPTLAICRGTQIVNVALGGTLIQDMTEALGADHRHVVQDLSLANGSVVAEIVSAPTLEISCYHHQALGLLAEGVETTAYADDGTIEAVELSNPAGWFVGVQWHPEDNAATNAEQAALFGALVEAARVAALSR